MRFELFVILAQNALKPALRAWHKQLTPLADGFPWQKGICFVCGAAATLGELQENDQVKHLRCGQCGADWQFPRLQCMYCGNEDHQTLKHLYTESHRETMRVEVCDKCHGYLKVITSFAPTSPEMLTVEDLATLKARVHDYDTRGLAKRPDQTVDDLFAERFALYREYADIIIDCAGLTHEEVCARVMKELEAGRGHG